VAAADVVLDCSDNFATRHAVNARLRAARQAAWSAARRVGFDGQVSVYDSRAGRRAAATPACSRPSAALRGGGAAPRWACSRRWWASIGTLQAAEALKLLAGVGRPLAGRLLMLDARGTQWTELQAGADPGCPARARGTVRRPPHRPPHRREQPHELAGPLPARSCGTCLAQSADL
jgi:molybdopterin/thiamine biosynthesis adenylyltransferase